MPTNKNYATTSGIEHAFVKEKYIQGSRIVVLNQAHKIKE